MPTAHLWPVSITAQGKCKFYQTKLVISLSKSPWHRSGAALIQSQSAGAAHGLPRLPNTNSTQMHFYPPGATAEPITEPVQGQLVPK